MSNYEANKRLKMSMANMTDCDFYIPDVTGGDNTGIAFRVASGKANYVNVVDSNKLCSYVGSMLCSVVPGFRNTVEQILNGIGVRPRFVSLPSQATENNITISSVSEMDWSSILVMFGYCVLVLFKIDNNELFNCDDYMIENIDSNTKRIKELIAKVGCCRKSFSSIPFDKEKENAIRTMLGTHALRNIVITFIVGNLNNPDSQICHLCNYLSEVLSWSGDMRVMTVMNKWLVKSDSPVLSKSKLMEEVDNLERTIRAVSSHEFPQYFSHICLASELFHFNVSRFPNLFVVALMLSKGCRDSEGDMFTDAVPDANCKTVEKMVKLHRKYIAKKGISNDRFMPTIYGT